MLDFCGCRLALYVQSFLAYFGLAAENKQACPVALLAVITVRRSAWPMGRHK